MKQGIYKFDEEKVMSKIKFVVVDKLMRRVLMSLHKAVVKLLMLL